MSYSLKCIICHNTHCYVTSNVHQSLTNSNTFLQLSLQHRFHVTLASLKLIYATNASMVVKPSESPCLNVYKIHSENWNCHAFLCNILTQQIHLWQLSHLCPAAQSSITSISIGILVKIKIIKPLYKIVSMQRLHLWLSSESSCLKLHFSGNSDSNTFLCAITPYWNKYIHIFCLAISTYSKLYQLY